MKLWPFHLRTKDAPTMDEVKGAFRKGFDELKAEAKVAKDKVVPVIEEGSSELAAEVHELAEHVGGWTWKRTVAVVSTMVCLVLAIWLVMLLLDWPRKGGKSLEPVTIQAEVHDQLRQSYAQRTAELREANARTAQLAAEVARLKVELFRAQQAQVQVTVPPDCGRPDSVIDALNKVGSR